MGKGSWGDTPRPKAHCPRPVLLTAPAPPVRTRDYGGVLIPLELDFNGVELSFFSTTTVFGTPTDITLAELAIESFFPADEKTRQVMERGRSM